MLGNTCTSRYRAHAIFHSFLSLFSFSIPQTRRQLPVILVFQSAYCGDRDSYVTEFDTLISLPCGDYYHHRAHTHRAPVYIASFPTR